MTPTDKTALLHARIDNDFAYHKPPTPEVAAEHQLIRDTLKLIAHQIVDHTPAGREQAVAITKLEEVMFWANAAIARVHPVTP